MGESTTTTTTSSSHATTSGTRQKGKKNDDGSVTHTKTRDDGGGASTSSTSSTTTSTTNLSTTNTATPSLSMTELLVAQLLFVCSGVFLARYPPISVLAWEMVQGFVAAVAILSLVIPGRSETPVGSNEQQTTSDERPYKVNGVSVFVVALALYYGAAWQGLFSPSIVYHSLLSLLSVATAWSILVASVLYIQGKKGGHHGLLRNFLLGCESRPVVLGIDVMFHALGRVPALAWVLVAQSFAAEQYRLYESLSVGMVLYQVLVLLYAIDLCWFEIYTPSSFSAAQEQCGWLRIWTSYVWVPFFFSAQGWLLLTPPEESVCPPLIITSGVLFFVGYTIYRGASRQKFEFKSLGPEAVIWGERPLVIEGAKSQKQLLISGWWGLLRHAPYLGDILIAFSLSIPSVVSHPWMGFAYPVLLTVYLLCRISMVERYCSSKYAEIWSRYCTQVPYRLVPYIY